MAEFRTYQVVTVPRLKETDPRLLQVAERFREIRLRALQKAADAFASTYESESQRGIEQTVQRLSNPKAIHFLALSRSTSEENSLNDDDEIDHMLMSDWVGTIVLLGPEVDTELSVSSAQLSAHLDPFPIMTANSSRGPVLDDSNLPSSLHFHLNATYVDPSTRGGGLGKALIDAALQKAEAEAAEINASLRVTLSVYFHNVAARKLYERAGFQVVKEAESRSRPDNRAIHMELKVAAAP